MTSERATTTPCGVAAPAEARVAPVRRQSVRVRLVAVVVLTAFATVSLVTTVRSLGTYCLTSGNGPIGLIRF